MPLEDYSRWLKNTKGKLRLELENIQENPLEIEKRFGTSLAFGTAGLRGILGAGTSRMNIHTVGLATQAFAQTLLERKPDNKVVIAYDSRINSRLFAQTAASVFSANGIKTYLFDRLMPTPTLSFGVRRLRCDAGVMITASHNPAEYNGYKAYGSDGGQLTPDKAEAVAEKMQALDCFADVKLLPLEQAMETGMVEMVSQQVVEDYLLAVSALSLSRDRKANENLRVVYTPLHGAGLECVAHTLSANGFSQLTIVEEQKNPDGNFPTCPYPNPETLQAMEKGVEVCGKIEGDLLIATDPDSDRLGAWANGVLLTGNEIGALLLDYICQRRQASGTMPSRPVAVKSIVSSSLADKIAAKYGVEMITVLTGFKYIGQVISKMEAQGREKDFLFGFEESHGYLSGVHVRDKDAVNAALLLCELAAQLKKEGKTLSDRLTELYQEHGWLCGRVVTKAFEGTYPMEEMNQAMNRLRTQPPKELGGEAVTAWEDYLEGRAVTAVGGEYPTGQDKTNMLRYQLGDKGWTVVRPSGTEPKMKIYLNIQGETKQKAQKLAEDIVQWLQKQI